MLSESGSAAYALNWIKLTTSMKQLLLILSALMVMSSCARKITVQEAYRLSDKQISDSYKEVFVTAEYGGDSHETITFQVDIFVDRKDRALITPEDITLIYEEGRTRQHPLPKDRLINDLERLKATMEVERKADVAGGVIEGGSNVLGLLLRGQGVQSLVTGALYASDIASRRDGYKDVELSIEDEIAYHKEYTMNEEEVIVKGSNLFDVHFDNLYHKGKVTLEIKLMGETYPFHYRLETKQIKVE